jgi:hypothetical protein
VVDTHDLKRRGSPCPRARSHEMQFVVASGDHMHGMHHAEVLIMNQDPGGPGGGRDDDNSLGGFDGGFDGGPDDDFESNGPCRFLADRFAAQTFDDGKLSRVGLLPVDRLYGTFMVPIFDALIAGELTLYVETVSRRTTMRFFEPGSEPHERVSLRAPSTSCRAPRGSGPRNIVDTPPCASTDRASQFSRVPRVVSRSAAWT